MKQFKTAGKWVLSLILAGMVFMTFINAVLRYVAHTNITVFEELCRFLFIWTTFVGAIISYIEGKHVGVDELQKHLHGLPRLIVRELAEILILVAAIAIGWGGWLYFSLTYYLPAPASGLPMGVVNIVGLILAVFMVVITIRDMIRIFKEYQAEKGLKKEEEAKV